jgi:hypothetical protein
MHHSTPRKQIVVAVAVVEVGIAYHQRIPKMNEMVVVGVADELRTETESTASSLAVTEPPELLQH